MTENPYQPPNPTPDDDSPVEDASGADPPRYRGSLEFIQGELNEDEAIAMAMSCKEIPVTPELRQSKKTASSLNWWLLLVVIGLALLLFFYEGDTRSTSSSSSSSETSFSLGWNLVFVIGAPLTVLVVLYLLFRLFRVRFDESDPPLGGKTFVRINPLGCAIQKTTRDDRLIEVYCSWRQIQITASPDAWLLNVGMVNPFIIAKSFISDPNERSQFEALATDIARWQSVQKPQLNLDSIPESAAESFPNYRKDSCEFVISSVVEHEVRKSVAKQLRAELPEFKPTTWSLPKVLWWTFLTVIALLMVYVLLSIDWQSIETQWTVLVWRFVPLAIVFFFAARITLVSRKEIKINAAISGDSLWYDYRSLLLRLPLETLPYRRLTKGNLVLATPNGSTTIVLHPSHFASDQEFRELAARLIDE